ncbi:MAG: hypothetical protein ACP5GI_02940 [Sulfolobales archaeon]
MSCFTLLFEIIFSLSDEFTGLLDELARELSNRDKSKVILFSSGIIYTSENALLQLFFSSDETLYSPQVIIPRGFFRATGKITCTKAIECGFLYETLYNIAKSKRLRMRIVQ